jgi:hypothetical protein
LLFLPVQFQRGGVEWALCSADLWLLNPLVFTVSARGNAESIIITLILVSKSGVHCINVIHK